MNLFKRLFIIALAVVSFTSCELIDLQNPPTKQQMQGTWVLKQATDHGVDITSKINILNLPVTAIQLTDDDGMVGTMGPMFTYIVYGGSKWIEASAKMDQLFDYAKLQFNTGSFYVGDGQVDHFTVEAKLQATASVGGDALIDVLSILGVDASFLQKTVYHKFMNVEVSFDGKNTMIWTFDKATQASYNLKNLGGNDIVWNGWPTDSFQKCTFVFTRKTISLEDIVTSGRY